MNAQKLLGLLLVIVIVVVALVHGSISMSEGMRLAMHGWWFIWKIALVLFAGCVLLVRRMRGRPAASDAGVRDGRNQQAGAAQR
jgi:protein-S-isoprenylcysteine O-methyltransferase Ste14